MQKEVILIAAILGFSNASTVNRTSCPEVKTVNNFNLDSLGRGLWYIYGKYANEFERHKSTEIYKTYVRDNSYKLIANIPESSPEYVETEITLDENFNETGDVIVKVIYGHPRTHKIFKAKIVCYDPENYGIIYSCQFNEKENIVKEYAWVGSRSGNPETGIKAKIEDFVRSSEFLDFDKFEWLNS